MEKLQINEIADALGCPWQAGREIEEICTDSRSATPGCLFVALEGENFDGHDYVSAALATGAVAAVVHKPVAGAPKERLLSVANTQKALLDIAQLYLSKFKPKKIAITGSVGKTTTKDMIACVVAAGFTTLKTQGNENNEIGVPRTIFRLTPQHQAAVLELGMSGFGEIADLTLAVQPDIGIITNIGVSHMEHLGSRQNILKAKLELTQGMPDGAPLLLCGDNDLLATVQDPRLNLIFYGIDSPTADIKGEALQELPQSTRFTIVYKGQRYPAQIPSIGRHNVCNALCAFGVGQLLGIDPARCIEALGSYAPSGMRQSITSCGGVTIVKDCYNASPDSMRAALATLQGYSAQGRKIAILADMLELGSIAQAAHQEVGALAANCANMLLAYGEESKWTVQTAKDSGMETALHFANKADLTAYLQGHVQPGDVLWFKASRGMKLEEVIEALEQQLG